MSEATATAAKSEKSETKTTDYLAFIKVWQTSPDVATVAKRLDCTPESAQARASKYRQTEYAMQDKTENGQTVYFDAEGKETTDKEKAAMTGGKNPQPKVVRIRQKDEKGKDIVKRRGIPLKKMPKGNKQIDVDAALALIESLANPQSDEQADTGEGEDSAESEG